KTCNFKKAPYCIALALTNAKQGKFEDGFAFAGGNAYRVDKIISVKELIANLSEEYEKASSSDY
ncbi:MAG: nitronate monooxygenase, partial [Candidatus Atribacteria bacterium]|nr:nitronate monooxygenase [Candidatus Atribacteria bacterium]